MTENQLKMVVEMVVRHELSRFRKLEIEPLERTVGWHGTWWTLLGIVVISLAAVLIMLAIF